MDKMIRTNKAIIIETQLVEVFLGAGVVGSAPPLNVF